MAVREQGPWLVLKVNSQGLVPSNQNRIVIPSKAEGSAFLYQRVGESGKGESKQRPISHPSTLGV